MLFIHTLICYFWRKNLNGNEYHDFVLYQKLVNEVCTCTGSREPFCSGAAQLAVEHRYPNAEQCMSETHFKTSLKQQTDIVPLTCHIQPGLHLRMAGQRAENQWHTITFGLVQCSRYFLAALQAVFLKCLHSSSSGNPGTLQLKWRSRHLVIHIIW